VHGIAAAIEDTDLQLVLLPAPGRRQHEKVLRFVRQGHVDGVMLLSIHTGDILPERLREAEVPAVRVGRPLPAQPMPFVNADNRGGAREATAHLLATGRRSVATVTGPQDMTVAVDRLDGYRDALAAEGLDPDARLVAGGDFTLEGGERAMRELLERAPELDGVFVASDLMAVGALLALRAAGRRVPQDVGVVGFDDAPVAATLDPPLTTVRQPVEAMSRAIVDLLLRRIEGLASEDEHVLCETTLIRRSSA
jgi:DNA-binding LacI/PurR family transcriptional regulator